MGATNGTRVNKTCEVHKRNTVDTAVQSIYVMQGYYISIAEVVMQG